MLSVSIVVYLVIWRRASAAKLPTVPNRGSADDGYGKADTLDSMYSTLASFLDMPTTSAGHVVNMQNRSEIITSNTSELTK